MNAINNPNKSLFLSYSRRQTAWCDELYTAIDTYTHFYRWRDNKIPESADWWDSICVNIEGCFAFVAMISQDYLDSVYCMGELNYALKLNKPVIALMLQDVAYPQKLNEQRLQFARVDGLGMPEVINKVLSASNQITLAYVQDEFSTEIHPRKHLRPLVPTPIKSTPTPEEDVTLSEQIEEVTVHGQISTRDLLTRYGEEKSSNVHLARELLDKIAQREDVPFFFDVEEEDQELKIEEKQQAEAEIERLRLKKIRRDYDDLQAYVRTASATQAIRAIGRFQKAYPDFEDVTQLRQQFMVARIKTVLPVPFDWVDVPAGSVTLGKGYNDKAHSVGKTFDLPAFAMAKYPVTHAQYAKFMQARGYQEQQWWTDAGWEQRQKDKWTEARYWTDDRFKGDQKPIVGVSWYEAVAFCQWLSEDVGEQIMLPTEQQWQRAAQGDDNRVYPWGNDWDRNLCNNNVDEMGIGKKSLVIQYEGKGDSPFGVVDMAGNVWEWCLTEYESGNININGTKLRVLRGGSWNYFNTGWFACDCRDGFTPYDGDNRIGFRVFRFN